MSLNKELLAFFSSVGAKAKPGVDADWADRLGWSVTTSIILVFAVFTGAKQYFGSVIDCWQPAEFTGFMEQYAQQFCFVNSTYWIHDNESIPDDIEKRESTKIAYYQWAPWVLGLQALLFVMPHLIWRLLNWKSGINVKHVVSQAATLQTKGRSERNDELTKLGEYIMGSLRLRFNFAKSLADGSIRRPFISSLLAGFRVRGGNYLAVLYLILKVLSLVIAIGQLIILQAFLDKPSNFYGITMVKNWFRGEDWSEIGLFPRVTFCDFTIRIMGNQHKRFTMQCVLSINMLNEKIYTFLWWWVALLIIATLVSLVDWTDRFLFAFSRRNFVRSYLEASADWREKEGKGLTDAKLSQRIQKFTENFLGQDGVFVMRLVSWNAGVGVTAALMNDLYKNFRDVKKVARESRVAMKTVEAEL